MSPGRGGWVSRLATLGPSGRLSILLYHRVLPAPDALRPGEPDAATFAWQMRLLAEHWTPLPLDEALCRLDEGRLPLRAVSVTFDDGYADNAEIALPILRATGVPATFFIASGFLDGGRMFNDSLIETLRRLPSGTLDLGPLGHYRLDDMPSRLAACQALIGQIKYRPPEERERLATTLAERLDAPLPDHLMLRGEQVRALRAAGMLIGAHTLSHPILSRLDLAEAERDIVAGRARLEALLGEPVRLFAYPNGQPGRDYDERHVRLVRALGFEAAVSTAWGAVGRTSARFELPRFTPWDRAPARFALRLARSRWGKAAVTEARPEPSVGAP